MSTNYLTAKKYLLNKDTCSMRVNQFKFIHLIMTIIFVNAYINNANAYKQDLHIEKQTEENKTIAEKYKERLHSPINSPKNNYPTDNDMEYSYGYPSYIPPLQPYGYAADNDIEYYWNYYNEAEEYNISKYDNNRHSYRYYKKPAPNDRNYQKQEEIYAQLHNKNIVKNNNTYPIFFDE